MRSSGTIATPSGEAGTHVCWVFEGADRFRDGAVPFLAEGIERNERLVYVADRSSPHELADELRPLGDVAALVDRGVLHLMPLRSLYQRETAFEAERQIARYRRLTEKALASGHRGLRVAGDVTALVATAEARRQFVHYELAVDKLLADVPMSALCGYDRSAIGSPVAELCVVHPHDNAPSDIDPGFRLFHDAGRLRLAGEIDLANRDLFALALEIARAMADPILVLDLGLLRFIDVRGMAHLNGLRHALAAEGRTLRLVDVPPVVRRSGTLLGFEAYADAPLRGAR